MSKRNDLSSLKKFFKGGSAEEESQIRSSVFIKPSNIEEILNFDFHDSTIILGNKGVGKSMLVNILHEAYLQNGELSLLIKPQNLKCDEILSKQTLADKKSAAYNQILVELANLIGSYSQEKDNGVLNRDIIALQQLAVKNGATKRDLIQIFSNILVAALPKGKEIAQAILASQETSISENNLSNLVDTYLEEKNVNLWLLIDDIDEAGVSNDGKPFDYSACWSIISAARELVLDIRKLKCIISVRSDIWHLMTVVQRHGSSELDKLGHKYELKFSEEELRQIFNKRVELAAKDIQSKSGILTFFEEKNITLPGSTESQREWDKWLSKFARFRPRDLVQAVQALLLQARKDGVTIIGSKQAQSIMLDFAKQRVDNIIHEYNQICPQIREIIDNVAENDLYSFREIITLIEKLPSRGAIQIDGMRIQSPPTNEQKIRILQLLHMAYFLTPRKENDDKSYTHFNYNEYPNLINLNRYNDLQQYYWEVHPAFHAYVEDVKRNKVKI